MRIRRWHLAAIATLGLSGVSSAQEDEAGSEEGGAAYVVTYLEAVPSATRQVRDLLIAYAEASRRAAGNREFRPLERIGRPNHFAVLESWADEPSLDRYRRSAAAERFEASASRLLYSPPDRRVQRGLVTDQHGDAGPGAIYVLTHVDVIPPSLEPIVDELRGLAAASRSEPGNLRFDVLVTARPNHMTIVEVWQSAEAAEAHSIAPHNITFRKNLAPVQGALYDERLYRGL